MGLARLRERLTAAWQAASPGGWAEQDALERLLRLTGDTDALVTVISSGVDGRQSRQLRIAAELERAGRMREALTAAEAGLQAASHPDQALADIVADRYAALGRDADALAVRRDQFGAALDLDRYRALRDAAERVGDWPATRRWALSLLRTDAAERSRLGRPGIYRWPPEPVIIDALVDDGDLDGAWAAAPGLASEAQWLRLADLVAPARPADALAVYRRQIEPLRRATGERVYLRLARLLEAARACHRALGTEDEFGAYLAAVRAEGKGKRRLIAILDKHRLR